MVDLIPHFINHKFPGMPGGYMTVLTIFACLFIMLILWRHTKWTGWLAFLLAGAFYVLPLFIEYYH